MWLQIAITALIIATIPLGLVWFSRGQSKYQKLVVVTLFLTFDLILFGAFTRLTDSGLGCPDWPGCYGEANPFLAHASIHEAQTAMPTGPVTLSKAWIEMIHRYLAMGVGVLVVVQVITAWLQRSKSSINPWWPSLILFVVCLQGAFGAWTVTLKLQPIIVSTHLLLAMMFLALQVWAWQLQTASIEKTMNAHKLIRPATIALSLLSIQVALGAWVSTNYAALACQDYPMCNGSLLPAMDFEHGFSLWRHLGKSADGDYLPFSALVAIHWAHRSFAWIAISAIAYAGFAARKVPEFSRLGNLILTVVTVQFLTGVSTVFFSWPLLLAVAHNGGAALLVLLLTMLNCRTRLAAS